RKMNPGRTVNLSAISEGLDAEVASVSLFDDVPDALARLRRLGLKTWVASNLAPPYALPLQTLLAGLVGGFWFSLARGAVKPESAFFARLCRDVGCAPGLALMAGDSIRADVQGASAFGMRAVHLDRDAPAGKNCVRSLAELADLLEDELSA